MTLAELKAIKIIGNANNDMALLIGLSDFTLDESQPMEDRIEALRYLNCDVMGEHVVIEEADVVEFVELSKSLMGE
jgi:hypothetical protein